MTFQWIKYITKGVVMNCQNLSFSPILSKGRIERAEFVLGQKIVNKLICFALYLLGVDRASLSSFLKIPAGTIRSLVRGIHNQGLQVFEDKRNKNSTFISLTPPIITPEFTVEDSTIYLVCGQSRTAIQIPVENKIQRRVFLLTLFNQGLISKPIVAQTLNLSEDRIGKLTRLLFKDDTGTLIDKRKGQQQEYCYTPQVKAQLIEQFVIDIVGEGRTSGKKLSENLKVRCALSLSPRSISYHFQKLGLNSIKSTLPICLAELKKTVSDC